MKVPRIAENSMEIGHQVCSRSRKLVSVLQLNFTVVAPRESS